MGLPARYIKNSSDTVWVQHANPLTGRPSDAVVVGINVWPIHDLRVSRKQMLQSILPGAEHPLRVLELKKCALEQKLEAS